MFGFGKKKPFTQEEFDAAVADVRRRMTDGDYVSGSQAAAALRRSVESRNGLHNLMWGEAHLLEARVAMTLGDLPTALEHMRAAADLDGDDDETIRARLTAQMNLGDVLTEMGEFEEAEVLLREVLEKRRELYGSEHSEFGTAADSLSMLLLSLGRYEEAATFGKEAAEAYRTDDEQGRREAALILWLTAEKALHPDAAILDLLDPADLETLLPALADAPGNRVIDALVGLRWEVYARLQDRDAKLRCLSSIALESRALQRHEDRIRALEDYIELAETGGLEDEAALAKERLTQAREEASQQEPG